MLESWDEFKNDVSEQYHDLTKKFDNLPENVSDHVNDWFCTCNNHVHDGYGDCKGELHNEKYICYVRNPHSHSCKDYHIFYDFGADQYYTHELCTQPEEAEPVTCWDHDCKGEINVDVEFTTVCDDDCEAICCRTSSEEVQTPKKLPILETEVPPPATKEPLTCWDHDCKGTMSVDVDFTTVCGESDDDCEAICCRASSEEVQTPKNLPTLETEVPPPATKGPVTCWDHYCKGEINLDV